MDRFAMKKIENITGKQRFEQLVIYPVTMQDNINLDVVEGVWDKYEKDLEVKYRNAFKGLETVMLRIADLQGMGYHRIKDITPANEYIKEYEFKFQDLRAYGIKIPNGKLIVLAGHKNTQREDIKKFRSLKRRFLEFIKNNQL